MAARGRPLIFTPHHRTIAPCTTPETTLDRGQSYTPIPHIMFRKRGKRREAATHPYLAGNFAPVLGEYAMHPCEIVHGEVPMELKGGQYIRNGGNPVHPPESGRHYHW